MSRRRYPLQLSDQLEQIANCRYRFQSNLLGRYAKASPAVRALVAAFVLLASCLVVVAGTASPAAALTTATQISPGGLHTCAVMTGGNAYCWGDNSHGELGDGTTTSSASPVLVSGGYTWASISAFDWGGGESDTCGLTTAGVGYCWGTNFFGAVGDGTTSERHAPTLVSGSHTWASLSTGRGESCGITTVGDVYCWGILTGSTPSLVPGGYNWASVSVGKQEMCGVTTSGAGYCWGGDGDAQGNGTFASQSSPTLISGGYTWANISIGDFHACGVTTSGAGFCWGRNSHGGLGVGNTTDSNVPVSVSGSYTWSTISANDSASCGLTTAGKAYCWGYDGVGQLGGGVTGTDVYTPTSVSGGLTFSALSAGTSELYNDAPACGLALDGIAYCWGLNGVSQLGDGTTTNRNVPTETGLLFAITANVTVAVTVDPSFTFTVAGRGSVCNGQSSTNFQTGATATAVSLGHTMASTVGGGAQDLSVATNAANGFAVYIRTSGTTPDSLRDSAAHSIADVSGTNASPGSAPVGGTAGFGYTSSDTSTPFTSNTWAKLTNTNLSVLIGSAGTNSKSACLGYEVAVAATTPAGSYTSNVIYTAVPAF